MLKKFENMKELIEGITSELLKNDYRFNKIFILDEMDNTIFSIDNFEQFDSYLAKYGIWIGYSWESITVKIQNDEYGVIVSFYGYSPTSGGNTHFIHCFSPLELNYKR